MGKILSAILLFCAFSAPAFAQLAEKISTSEDVAIAFFKTGGHKPDFVKWAKRSDKHATVQKVREGEYLIKETGRLNKLWDAFDPATGVLMVRTQVGIALSISVEDGTEKYAMQISFEKGSADYFPFQFQDYAIAVIPENMDTLLTQRIPKEQYELLKANLDGNDFGRGTLYFQLSPLKADLSRPYEMDNTEQWVLNTKIAGLALKNAKGAPLWNYSAPWHVTTTTKDVRTLYTKQESKERADDAAEGIAP